MHSLEELNAQVVEHNTHRKHFDRTPDELAQQIQEEAAELVGEVTRSLLTGEVVNVVGEVGDLYILLAQFCDQLGINPVHAMQMKQARNAQKYDDYVTNNGYTRDEAIKLSKQMWKERGGDQSWSHVYLEYLAEEER
jgi:NTP pyrophosphatase (non-canonical NTP hydrolase)